MKPNDIQNHSWIMETKQILGDLIDIAKMLPFFIFKTIKITPIMLPIVIKNLGMLLGMLISTISTKIRQILRLR